MMNGGDINDAIDRADKGTVALLMKEHGISTAFNDKPSAMIRDLFLATLNREPSQKEIATIEAKFNLVRPKLEAEDRTKPERQVSGSAVGAGQQQRVPAEPLSCGLFADRDRLH